MLGSLSARHVHRKAPEASTEDSTAAIAILGGECSAQVQPCLSNIYYRGVGLAPFQTVTAMCSTSNGPTASDGYILCVARMFVYIECERDYSYRVAILYLYVTSLLHE